MQAGEHSADIANPTFCRGRGGCWLASCSSPDALRRSPAGPSRRPGRGNGTVLPQAKPPACTQNPPQPTPPTRVPAGAIPLPPDENGYVFIETKSGKTRCQIDVESVGCEAPFTNSPMTEGEHANGVNVTAAGAVQWVLGNLGAIPAVTIDYRTYTAQGWTITATVDGTRFTNDRTGHGMFVSIENVETF
ncbi:putative lpqJ [Mycobacterium xenopi 4042]|uniref:Putative lpqJ n=1 Tax=Mycobacterium xenopi 4042 TaxID=1299334 RepID=X8DLF8_MYCXE|nr:putative lpqJ [Mycobacterium xenopi 4042]